MALEIAKKLEAQCPELFKAKLLLITKEVIQTTLLSLVEVLMWADLCFQSVQLHFETEGPTVVTD